MRAVGRSFGMLTTPPVEPATVRAAMFPQLGLAVVRTGPADQPGLACVLAAG